MADIFDDAKPGVGHNSGDVVIVSGENLKPLVERIERLAKEKQDRADDIKEVFAEAKANGYDTKILRKVIARRKRDRNEIQEEEALIDLYEQAVGVFG